MAYDHTRARGPRQPPRVNQRDELADFTVRLRANGATDDEIAATAATWDDFDTDWTPGARRQMVRWSDARIRAELTAVRAEYANHMGQL